MGENQLIKSCEETIVVRWQIIRHLPVIGEIFTGIKSSLPVNNCRMLAKIPLFAGNSSFFLVIDWYLPENNCRMLAINSCFASKTRYLLKISCHLPVICYNAPIGSCLNGLKDIIWR